MTTLTDLPVYCAEIARRARIASRHLATVPTRDKDRWLRCAARLLQERQDEILAGNQQDLVAAVDLSAAQRDRLRLTPERLKQAGKTLHEIAALADPIGLVHSGSVRPNGLQVTKVGVPLGVIFFIYESRPNVTVDAAALGIKSGNALILRGGREASQSNQALHAVLRNALVECGLPADAVQLVATLDRAAVGHLLQMNELIDLVIPRGGESLIRRVVAEARMPVLKHYRGNCHIYVEASADLEIAERIIINSKCQRPGVCNAAESLLIDEAIASTFLPRLAASLTQHNVQIRGCSRTCACLPTASPASEEDWAEEYLDLIISVKVVKSITEAIEHINRFGSKHTDAIVTRDLAAARRFAAEIDSAAVVVNASTRFHDGGELGLGAEIGISTDKFHARGPCGLLELTTYKYVLIGDGQVRD